MCFLPCVCSEVNDQPHTCEAKQLKQFLDHYVIVDLSTCLAAMQSLFILTVLVLFVEEQHGQIAMLSTKMYQFYAAPLYSPSIVLLCTPLSIVLLCTPLSIASVNPQGPTINWSFLLTLAWKSHFDAKNRKCNSCAAWKKTVSTYLTSAAWKKTVNTYLTSAAWKKTVSTYLTSAAWKKTVSIYLTSAAWKKTVSTYLTSAMNIAYLPLHRRT